MEYHNLLMYSLILEQCHHLQEQLQYLAMKDFYKDVQHWVDYDFVVINDNLNECYDEISQLIDLSLKTQDKEINYNKKRISDHVDKLIN